MALSVEQQILIEQRITNDGKSTLVAYILWFFFYGLAMHRFYLGYIRSAIAMLAISALGVILAMWGLLMLDTTHNPSQDMLAFPLFIIGFSLCGVILVWAIADAFLIPGMVRQQRNALRMKLTEYYTQHKKS